MSVSVFTEPVSSLYRHVGEMAGNIGFIAQELPRLEMESALRAAVTQACRDFEWTLYDVRKEIRTLEDKLGMHPDQEPFDPNVSNRDPKVTISLIDAWLRTELDALQVLVTDVKAAAASDPDRADVFLLVTESATNILNAYLAVRDVLEFISAVVDEANKA